MPLTFSKYEGLGNDFIVVDGRTADLSAAERSAVQLCDRHRGVGADGVLLVSHAGEHPRMRVVNADGSRPEMCGNGIRCVALHVARTGGPRTMSVATDAGPHACEVTEDGLVSVSMVAASFAPQDVRVTAEQPLIDAPFDVAGETLPITAVSMGNPHAVTFAEVGDRRLTLGPRLAADRRFFEGVNVGFARATGQQAFELHVLERGVGWTEACGTGACACAAAAVATGRAGGDDPIAIALPGGTLWIGVGAPGARITMTGPARHVFDGELS